MAKVGVDKNHQGQLGVAWTQWIVEGLWSAGLEVISAHNDDGIDAIILLKRRRKSSYAGPTGDIVFAQIKCGYVQKDPTSDYSINLGKEYLSTHIPRWLSYPGPVIIINVIPPRLTGAEPKAYWVNLRDRCFDEERGTISFSITQDFNLATKSDLFNLCWRWSEFRKLPIIRAEEKLPFELKEVNLKYLSASANNIIVDAKKYYKNWKTFADNNRHEFTADITWLGWKHMTRYSRPSATKHQSLQLLPVALRMLLKDSGLKRKRLSKNNVEVLKCGQERVRWYEGMTSRVTFYERHEAVITLVIQCTQLRNDGKITYENTCFYSLFEVARRKSFI